MKKGFLLFLTLLLLAFVFSRNISANNSKIKCKDGQLYVLEPEISEWQLLNDLHKIDPNQENQLIFKYIVRRTFPYESKPGAILIKVIRVYNQNWNINPYESNYIGLYRNEFPQKAKFSDRVRREIYNMYHQDEIDNIFLRNSFHAIFSENQRTDNPEARRKYFLFNNSLQNSNARYRTYLLHYKGIKESGTEMTFRVGVVRRAFSKIYISISDLNPPSDIGYLTRNWEISIANN